MTIRGRPTVRTNGMDLSAVTPDASAAAASSRAERALFHGYSRSGRVADYEWIGDEPGRSEPCACGGIIRAESLSDYDARRAVDAHAVTPEHLAWREREAVE